MSDLKISVPRQHLTEFLAKHFKSIENCYCVKLVEFKNNIENSNENVDFIVKMHQNETEGAQSQELVHKIQKYVNSAMSLEGGEDSSYDSECEDSDENSNQTHRSASRTPSDTLAAEFEEYVNVSPSTSNSAKVEFALKMGYTEKQAHAAMKKLGPDLCDNELLSELINLSSQQPCQSEKKNDKQRSRTQPALRPIVIDGSNVAISHGNKEVFSCKGIEICVDYFRSRGHREITVFVPKWRKESTRPDNRVVDRDVLDRLEKKRVLVFTPSRYLQGKRLICYDDRYILKLAAATEGVVVSNDNYRDLVKENPEFRRVVEERLLMYTFVNHHFMPPDDPLGRNGPTLDTFLRMPATQPMSETICPYGRKCTYGNRCKYNHPERSGQAHRTVAERQTAKASKFNRNSNLQTLSLPPAACSNYNNDIPRTHSAAALGNTSPETMTSSENPHRKLARQLSLLPSADPRLPGLLAATTESRRHPTAIRVSSAPVGVVREDFESYYTLQETRRIMRSRLVGIFPEYQVDETMLAYPDETDARRMCAIILERFSGR